MADLAFGAGRIARAPGAVAPTAGEFAYAAWWWCVVSAGFLFGVLAVLVLPRLSWRWSAVRAIARSILAGVGAWPRVGGADRLPRASAILMFNYASYADALVLAAVLPGEPAYLAKKEFASQLLVGLLLRRLGVLSSSALIWPKAWPTSPPRSTRRAGAGRW